MLIWFVDGIPESLGVDSNWAWALSCRKLGPTGPGPNYSKAQWNWVWSIGLKPKPNFIFFIFLLFLFYSLHPRSYFVHPCWCFDLFLSLWPGQSLTTGLILFFNSSRSLPSHSLFSSFFCFHFFFFFYSFPVQTHASHLPNSSFHFFFAASEWGAGSSYGWARHGQGEIHGMRSTPAWAYGLSWAWQQPSGGEGEKGKA